MATVNLNEISKPLETPVAPKKKRGFFEPSLEGVRIRDVLRELPGAVKETAKDIARIPTRAAGVFSIEAQRRKELVPETPSEKFLFGEKPVKDIAGTGQETLEAFGISPESAAKVAFPVGFALTTLDIIPGFGSFRRKAFSAAEDVVKLVVQSTDRRFIYDIIKKEIPDIAEKRLVSVSKRLASERNPDKVANVLNNEIRLRETGKIVPTEREAIEIPKEVFGVGDIVKIRNRDIARIVGEDETRWKLRFPGDSTMYSILKSGEQKIRGAITTRTIKAPSIKKATLEDFGEIKPGSTQKKIDLRQWRDEVSGIPKEISGNDPTQIAKRAKLGVEEVLRGEAKRPTAKEAGFRFKEDVELEEKLAREAAEAAAKKTPTLREVQLDETAVREAEIQAAEREGRFLDEIVVQPEEQPTIRALSELLPTKDMLKFRREADLDSLRDSIANHPARPLLRYVSRQTGELPEVIGTSRTLAHATGKKFSRSVWGLRGDQLATQQGYADENAAAQGVKELRRMIKREKELTTEIFQAERALGKEIKETRFEEARLKKVEVLPTKRRTLEPSEAEYTKYRDSIHSNSNFAKRFLNRVRAFVSAPSKVAYVKKEISKMKSDDPLISHLLRASSSRLKQIHPELKRVIRDLEFNREQWFIKKNRQLGGWFEAMKKISKTSANDVIDLSFALLRKEHGKALQIAEKHGARKEFENLFATLDEVYQEAKDAGVEVSFLEDFFPRFVANPSGLMRFIRERYGDPTNWRFFNQALQREAERLGRTPTTVEQADVINRMLMGRTVNGISVKEIGVIPHRTVDVINSELAQFYGAPDEALSFYLRNMSEKIQYAKLFNLKGKDGELSDVMGSLGARILGLKKTGGLSVEQEMEVLRIFQARVKERGTRGIIAGFKNLTYASTIGNPFSAIRQIGDFGAGMYKAKSQYLSAWLKAALGKSEIKIGDVLSQTIENSTGRISAEFQDYSRLSRWLSKMLKVVGFEKMDTIGKEALMNGVVARYQKLARADKLPPQLNRRLREFFGDNTEGVLADLREGKVTENVRMLAFNELAEVQPIALSEMPVQYLTAGNGRLFYMLKSWQIKQLNFYIDEIKDLAKNEPKQAIFQLMELAAFLMVANASADVIIDTILGREIDPGDLVVDNTLRLAGVNRYLVNKARQEGAGAAIEDLIFPPTNIIDNVVRDANRFFKGETEKGFETPQNIPLLGKFYYWRYGRGAEKERDKRIKGTSGQFGLKVNLNELAGQTGGGTVNLNQIAGIK